MGLQTELLPPKYRRLSNHLGRSLCMHCESPNEWQGNSAMGRCRPTCRARTRLPSVNPLLLAQLPQTDESKLPLHLRLNGLSGAPNLPANPPPVTHVELA
jgi:hypothetical protein